MSLSSTTHGYDDGFYDGLSPCVCAPSSSEGVHEDDDDDERVLLK